jgi:hypothetical protein
LCPMHSQPNSSGFSLGVKQEFLRFVIALR